MFSTDTFDKRLVKLIKLSQKTQYRAFCVILGRNGTRKISSLYQLLERYRKSSKSEKISTLWSFKNNFEVFRAENKANVAALEKVQTLPTQYSSYKDTEDIVHQTFDLVILQDLDGASMHNLASIVGTVNGGGLIVLLFHNVNTLTEFTSVNLNSQCKLSRFSKRFNLSLMSCPNTLILDDDLNILSSHLKAPEKFNETPDHKNEILKLQEKFENDANTSSLLGICKTVEQAELLLKFLEVLQKRTFHGVCSVSSAVGRGKSAALGLAIAGSLALNYSNIYISSMCYKNVQTVFRFLLKGLDALKYEEDEYFDLIQSVHPELENALTGVNVFKDHPQSVRFIFARDIGIRLDQAELLVLDEAAAIPPPLLKKMLGSHVTLMASSVSGCGASSPHLYDTMIASIQPPSDLPNEASRFHQITLSEPVLFASGDCVESWLNRQLCTELSVSSQLPGCPHPDHCNLFLVNRDHLFSGSDEAESLLTSLTSLLCSSDGSINPDKLVELADSPDHHLFCLLSPDYNGKNTQFNILCAILVHLEKGIPKHIVRCGTNLSGPVSTCFNDWKSNLRVMLQFAPLQGIHILNIVTHPSYRKMGYGLRSLRLLHEFYEGKCVSLEEEEDALPKAAPLRLLQKLTEVQPDVVDYSLLSCGLDSRSLRFWRKAGYIPVYLSETLNTNGDYVLFVLKSLTDTFKEKLEKYWCNFRSHFSLRLCSAYRDFSAFLALTLMHFNPSAQESEANELTKDNIDVLIKPHQMKSLEQYCQNLQEFHSIIHHIPTLTVAFFNNRIKVQLSRVQEAILLSYGLQFKTAEQISSDLGLPHVQIHGLLNRSIRRIVRRLNEIVERAVEETLDKSEPAVEGMEPLKEGVEEELEAAGLEIVAQQQKDALRSMNLSQYAIKGSEDDWERALNCGRKTLVSIKSIKKITNLEKFLPNENTSKNKREKKGKGNKRRK